MEANLNQENNAMSVFQGMPSLLGQNTVLAFSNNWPLLRNLPNLREVEIEDSQKLSAQQPSLYSIIIGTMRQFIGQEMKTIQSVQQTKKQNKCGHTQKKHYAKNLCMSCYFRIGRSKKATKCKHINKPMHAKGMCSKCYQKWIKQYNKENHS